MPHTKSAWKRMAQAEKRKLHNRTVIKKVKAQVRAFLAPVKAAETARHAEQVASAAGDTAKASDQAAARTQHLNKAAEEMKTAGKLLDRAGTKGYIHANKASRLKSRMAHRLDKAKKAATK
jgi:ribosomal protein S20